MSTATNGLSTFDLSKASGAMTMRCPSEAARAAQLSRKRRKPAGATPAAGNRDRKLVGRTGVEPVTS
jgi:hypothetical protein